MEPAAPKETILVSKWRLERPQLSIVAGTTEAIRYVPAWTINRLPLQLPDLILPHNGR
jgi:hypothetical protein